MQSHDWSFPEVSWVIPLFKSSFEDFLSEIEKISLLDICLILIYKNENYQHQEG